VKLTVAIPKYGDEIAPCFERAGQFLIIEIKDKTVINRAIHECSGCEGFERVRLLKKLDIDRLICDGIKSFYHDLLRSEGITVFRNITATVERALDLCLKGELIDEVPPRECPAEPLKIPLQDMICWAKDLFRSHGFQISKAADLAPFPVDLIAEMRCPVCHKPVRVAICCGSHTYRIDQELKLFHRVATADFHSQVYVYPANSTAAQICNEYGIELLEPGAEMDLPGKKRKRIPLLRLPVSGHEQASGQLRKPRRLRRKTEE
jgi:predicted Fe-Mo cluster-binding NifX family protein